MRGIIDSRSLMGELSDGQRQIVGDHGKRVVTIELVSLTRGILTMTTTDVDGCRAERRVSRDGSSVMTDLTLVQAHARTESDARVGVCSDGSEVTPAALCGHASTPSDESVDRGHDRGASSSVRRGQESLQAPCVQLPRTYAISARVEVHHAHVIRDDVRIACDPYYVTIDLPTIYLMADVQGIVSESHAESIVVSMLASLGHDRSCCHVQAVATSMLAHV